MAKHDRGESWAFSVARRAAAIALIVMFAVLAFGAQSVVGGLAQAVRGWDRLSTDARTGQGTAHLFLDLVRAGLLRFNPADGRLQIEDCDYARRNAIAGQGDGFNVQEGGHASLMRRYCLTDTGKTIQTEIDVWNRIGFLLAVRDDRLRGRPCENGEGDGRGLLIVEGCHAPRWSVAVEAQPEEFIPAAPSASLTPAADVFGVAAAERREGYGDWLAVETTGLRSNLHRLSTMLAPSDPRRLTVQTIGRIEGASLNGQPVNGTIRSACRGRSAMDLDCPADPSAGLEVARADAFEINLPASSEPLRLEVDVRPLRLPPSRLPERLVSVRTPPEQAEDRKRALIRQQVESIALRCDDPGARSADRAICFLDWIEGKTGVKSAAKAPATFRIAAGRLALAETKTGAVATDEAIALGLGGWIGVSERDSASLAWAADRQARAGRPVSLPLTIDEAAQRQANDALVALMTGEGRASAALARKAPTRRGGIVLMDAEERPGAILAATLWPQLGRGRFNEWDLIAYDRFRPAASPLTSRAWTATDQLMAPGSTFKVATALAILQASADGDETMRRAVLGLPTPELRRLLAVETCQKDGGAYDCINVDGQRIGDVDGRPLARVETPIECPFGGAFAAREKTIGLRQALAKSSNMWFAALAARLPDPPAASQPCDNPGEGRWADHYLTRAICRTYPVIGPGQASGRFYFSLMEGAGTPFSRLDRLSAQPIVADFLQGGPEAKRRLALAAYGQTVQATPAAMASLMAGVALGVKVKPFLWSETPGGARFSGAPLLERVDWGRQDQLLSELKCGLWAVVNAPGGSAAGEGVIDKSLKQDMFAKTGTAEIEGSDLDTGWFVGWLEGRAGTGLPKRVAFACFVTHSSKGGGEVCGKTMSDLLLGLRRSAPQTDAPQPRLRGRAGP